MPDEQEVRPFGVVPEGATDCHHHIYDAQWPSDPNATFTPPDASVSAYQTLQAQLGLVRSVVVQPSTYGFDNRLLAHVLSLMGKSARGVAVISPACSKWELERLHEVGIRGARVNLLVPGGITENQIESLANRIQDYGWHLQLVAGGDQIQRLRDTLSHLPVQLVVDHMGLIPLPNPIQHSTFGLLCKWAQQGKAWIKLSGVCNLSESGSPDYADYAAVGQAFARAIPDRLIWGSDWPHVLGKFKIKPDDAQLFGMLWKWLPDDSARKKVLVDNPRTLYGF